MLRVVASKVSALTVTLMAVMPDEAMASRWNGDSGPRGGHETFIDPGLARASITIDLRGMPPLWSCGACAAIRALFNSAAPAPTVAANWRRLMVRLIAAISLSFLTIS